MAKHRNRKQRKEIYRQGNSLHGYAYPLYSALHLERGVLHLGPLPHPKDNPTQCVQLPTETLCRGGLSELEAMPLVLCGLQFHIVEDIQLHLLTV